MSAVSRDTAPVIVTDHAALRARERFGWKPARVRERVREAIAAGRVSGVRPAWMGPASGKHYRLYAWTEDRGVVFGLSGGESAWHVYTVFGAE